MNGKVAIVTLYDDINIGNKLQNYALQEILKDFFSTIETLTYTEATEISPIIGWKGKLVLRFGFPRKKAREKEKLVERKNRFREFSRQYINIASPKPFKDYNNQVSNEYSFFVVGSDQVWHNFSNTKEELYYFFLQFVDRNKRICYAPSFGFDNIPDRFLQEYSDGLKGFDVLSCREIKGCELIKRTTGVNAYLMPDPTLVIPQEKWIEMEKEPEYLVPATFILVYFVGDLTSEQLTLIDELSQNEMLPIIDIHNIKELNYYSTRPDEFIYLVRRAQYVITDSFHGAVFSVLFDKEFKLYKRNDRNGKKMSSRIDTLIKELSLHKGYNGFYHQSGNTKTIIEHKKKESYDYLNKAFSKNSCSHDVMRS